MRAFIVNLPFAVAAVLMSACFYDPDLSKIAEEEDDGTGPAGETDSAPVDAGGVSGLGAECEESEDCSDFDADYCLTDPTQSDEPGHCTVSNCDTGGCPDAFQCCDCSGVGMAVICIPEDNVDIVSQFCSCD